ncbi:hypothetical protein [Amycolatopsis sp.]|uniref:hypothetical protein n=1 Tax=Amycolatopsis sp. TaxID=37632 RepID=UPI002D7E5352|nr:hypothetical protein [Amycolatopsis sp.]HET6708315.1 hypothetical protein [Amycolatopsis sp.]
MRKRILASLLTVGLLAGTMTAVLVAGAGPASAWVGDFRPATWNMQGGNDGKWNPGVTSILNAGHDVIALQEAGPSAPRSAHYVRDFHLGGYRVQQYDWSPFGQRGQVGTVTITFMQTDFGANRVNLAIVSRVRPRNFIVVPAATGFAGARPALGVDLNGTVFYTVHALSGGGNDARRLIDNLASEARGRAWGALGDWNRNPWLLDVGRGPGEISGSRTIIRPNHQTQRSGNELDYMVVGNWERPHFAVATMEPGGSDHYVVTFGPLRAAADVYLYSAHEGNRALQAGTQNEDVIIGSVPQGFDGTWQFLPAGSGQYLIKNRTRNLCLEPSPGRNVGLWSGCSTGNWQQRWALKIWRDSDQLLIQSVAFGGCLRDDAGRGYGSHVVTGGCNDDSARWNFGHDYEPPPNAPVIPV